MLSIAASHGMDLEGTALEHLDIASALDVPFFVVITKVDVTNQETFDSTVAAIKGAMKMIGKEAMIISSTDDLAVLDNEDPSGLSSSSSTASTADSIVNGHHHHHHHPTLVPVFLVSNVTGKHHTHSHSSYTYNQD